MNIAFLRIAHFFTLFLTLACVSHASESGGSYLPLEEVLKKKEVVAIVKVNITTSEKQDVDITALVGGVRPKGPDGEDPEYSSTQLQRIIIDAEIEEVISGKLKSGKLTALKYEEPVFTYHYRLLPNGEKKNEMHSLGFLYNGSGKEFDICIAGKEVILLLGEVGNGLHYIIRAEPGEPAVIQRIQKALDGKAEDSDPAK